MPDSSSEAVRRRLGSLRTNARRAEEIVAELADHIDDIAEEWLRRGATVEEATQHAFNSISDWSELRCRICDTEREEDVMNQRTKSLWLPGLVTLTLSCLWMVPFVWADIHGKFLWAKIVWVSPSSIYMILWWPWLAVLPVIGTLGGYWSWRAGGRLTQRVLASLFPSVALAAVFVLIATVGLFLDHRMDLAFSLQSFGMCLLNWAVIPGIALLFGASPFLKGGKHQPS